MVLVVFNTSATCNLQTVKKAGTLNLTVTSNVSRLNVLLRLGTEKEIKRGNNKSSEEKNKRKKINKENIMGLD